MANKSGITVNGVILEEFIKGNEQINEETERTKLIIDSVDRIYPDRHIKPKYKAYKEKNGKVRTLSALDISVTNYSSYLEKALKNKDLHRSFIIVLALKHGKNISINDIADFIENFIANKDMQLDPKMRHAMRAKLGYIKKSKLFEYMTYLDRKDSRNSLNYTVFSLDSEKAKDLTIEKAVELGSILKPGMKYSPGPKIKTAPKSIQKPKPDMSSIKITEEKPTVKPNKIIDEVMGSISDVIKSGSLINVQGDIHIHINIRGNHD